MNQFLRYIKPKVFYFHIVITGQADLTLHVSRVIFPITYRHLDIKMFVSGIISVLNCNILEIFKI